MALSQTAYVKATQVTDMEILTWDKSVTAKQFSENINSIKETYFRVYDWALCTPEVFAVHSTDLPSGKTPAEYPDARTVLLLQGVLLLALCLPVCAYNYLHTRCRLRPGAASGHSWSLTPKAPT